MTTASPSHLIRSVLSIILGLSFVMATASVDAQPREKKDPYLTDDDIELIKVFEVNLQSDPPPRVVIPRDVLRDFVKEFQASDEDLRGKSNQEAFIRAKGHIQLDKIFEHRARSYYKHVRVRSQIASLREWGTIHRRYILGYFQPAFGTGKVALNSDDGNAGRHLFLFPQGRNGDKIEMTNFYILTQVRIDGKPMIDRNAPEDSLLLQWGLPREEAKFPAPDIDGWQPEFKDMDDEEFVKMVKWIETLIPENQDETLGIQFKMPQHKKPRN